MLIQDVTNSGLFRAARPILKGLLPMRFRQFLHRVRIQRVDGQFDGLDRQQLFDAIYTERMWGGTADRTSGWGSYGDHSTQYIEFVNAFVLERGIDSTLDIGCGDFYIGQKICPNVNRYIAADVSAVIVERNRAKFQQFPDTEFRVLDVCADDLPRTDLLTIREVLQHLSNDDISAALLNIEKAKPRFVLVTEHLPDAEVLLAPNLNKPRGPNIRNPFGSGVFIDKPPFNRNARVVLSVRHPSFKGSPSHLVTYLWEPTAV